MSDYLELADELTKALNLTVAPVAIRFVESDSEDVAEMDSPVSAGCQFWERGAQKSVLTGTRHHANCAVGIHTHNLADAPDSQSSELMEVLAAMKGLDYVRDEEVAAIPVRQQSSKSVLYEPLSEATEQPDVVMLFAHSAQSLVLSEALHRVDGQVPPAMGRPACAVVPQVSNTGLSAMSLGCCGARVYLDALTDDIALWGLAGDKLEQYVSEIKIMSAGNEILTKFHDMRRQDIEAGKLPTVQDSLARLG